MFGFMAAPCRGCSAEAGRKAYQAVFCGLSCQLSREYSPLARFLVNRDAAYLALLGQGLSAVPVGAESRACCNPLGASRMVLEASPLLSYTAAVTVCGLAAKLDDDRSDERGWRRVAALQGGYLIGPARDRAVATLNALGFPTQQVVATLARQSSVERGRPTLAAAAAPTAQAYGVIFGHLGEVVQSSTPGLRQIGEQLGALIYLRDAYDDRAADAQAGRFNPLSYTSLGALREVATDLMSGLQQAQSSLPLRSHTALLSDVLSSTSSSHLALTSGQTAGTEAKKAKKKRKREKSDSGCCSKWDCCDIPCSALDCSDCCSTMTPRGAGGCCDSCSCNCCD